MSPSAPYENTTFILVGVAVGPICALPSRGGAAGPSETSKGPKARTWHDGS